MATFPILKTGSSVQYPLGRTVRFSSQTVHFLDGGRQNYLLDKGGLRRWVIQLELLDETELAAMMAFVDETSGNEFIFHDPSTGEDVENCVIRGPRFSAWMADELDGRTTLEIEELG